MKVKSTLPALACSSLLQDRHPPAGAQARSNTNCLVNVPAHVWACILGSRTPETGSGTELQTTLQQVNDIGPQQISQLRGGGRTLLFLGLLGRPGSLDDAVFSVFRCRRLRKP